MSENRQYRLCLIWGGIKFPGLQCMAAMHPDPTKSSAISKRNCRVRTPLRASKPSGLQALAGHEVSRLGALLGVRGTGRSGNGSGKWQHRDGSCSSCVPTHGRNRLAAAMLHQRLDRAHYQWAQAESSTGQPRSLQACSARPFARIPGPFTRCLLC